MSEETLAIRTVDGTCPATLYRPDGDGQWPAVILYVDGVGIRPAMHDMARRLAGYGYVVLLPDLFYRAGPYTPPDPRTLFTDPAARAAWAPVAGTATQANVMADTKAFLDVLGARADVRGAKVGVTGYCMGGGLALAAAGFYPERVAAAASYHGGRLATDLPDSPHLLAPKMRARVYVAGAVDDASFPDDMKQRLEAALTAAGVDHVVETYPGARHGWVPADMPVHDPVAAERHWETLSQLFASALA